MQRRKKRRQRWDTEWIGRLAGWGDGFELSTVTVRHVLLAVDSRATAEYVVSQLNTVAGNFKCAPRLGFVAQETANAVERAEFDSSKRDFVKAKRLDVLKFARQELDRFDQQQQQAREQVWKSSEAAEQLKRLAAHSSDRDRDERLGLMFAIAEIDPVARADWNGKAAPSNQQAFSFTPRVATKTTMTLTTNGLWRGSTRQERGGRVLRQALRAAG